MLTYKKFGPETLTKEVENDLWDKETGKPNIKLIVQLGKKLDVDAVFVCKGQRDSMEIYIIEMNKVEVFFKSYSYSVFTGYSNVPTQMKSFFANYKDFKVN